MEATSTCAQSAIANRARPSTLWRRSRSPGRRRRAAIFSLRCARSQSIRSITKWRAARCPRPAESRWSATTWPVWWWRPGVRRDSSSQATKCSTPAASADRARTRNIISSTSGSWAGSRARSISPPPPLYRRPRFTAWEAMFDRLDVARPVPGATRAILIVGGAGGVGSIATQLARQLTDLAVVATASRPETARWAKDMGAHHVVDHKKPLAPQVGALGLGAPAFVFATVPSGGLFADLAELIAPQGRLALINGESADVSVFMRKSVSVHYELMFTRPLFQTADIEAQHRLLERGRRSG